MPHQILLACLLLGCVFIQDPMFGYTARADWKTEWDTTVEAAKKEGQLNVYIGAYEGVLAEFKKAYPEIKVFSVATGTTEMAKKVLAERRAGKYFADLFSGGVNTQYNMLHKTGALDPLKELFLIPEVVDRSKWSEGYHFADPEGKYIFPYAANAGRGTIIYHVKLLNPKEFHSNWDLLNPKWKGKIVSLEPTDTRLGAQMIFLYNHAQLGPTFIERFFGSMDITFSRDQRQMTDWLAAGKFALCIGCRAYEAKEQGLPVDYLITDLWKEGGYSTAGIGALGYMNRAPHPNAAKVFANWFLSREGQMVLQRTGRPGDRPNSRRIDIPKDDVTPERRLMPGVKYLDINRPDWQDMAPIHNLGRSIMREITDKKK